MSLSGNKPQLVRQRRDSLLFPWRTLCPLSKQSSAVFQLGLKDPMFPDWYESCFSLQCFRIWEGKTSSWVEVWVGDCSTASFYGIEYSPFNTSRCVHAVPEQLETTFTRIQTKTHVSDCYRKISLQNARNEFVPLSPRKTPPVTGPEWRPMRIAKLAVSAPKTSLSWLVNAFILKRHSLEKRAMTTAWSSRATGKPHTAT